MMRRRLNRSSAALAAAVCACAWARVAAAEDSIYHEAVIAPPHVRELTVPLEFGHSAAWSHSRTGPAYEAEVAAFPGVLLFDRLGLHAAAEFHYRNPDLDLGLGGRISFIITPLLGALPVGVFAGASYLTWSNAAQLEAGGSFGLGRLAYVSLSVGYESDRQVYFGHLALGVDLCELGDPIAAIVHFVPEKVVP
jgi:hypothetical protein